MNARLAHLLVRLYPEPWRNRYGAELQVMLEAAPDDLRASANVVWSALFENVFPTPGLAADRTEPSTLALAKKPSASLPLAMSLAALTIVLGHAAIYGVVHEPDEGGAAHLWQLLILGQLPLIALFTLRWLRRAARQTARVLFLLAGMTAANFAGVFFLT